MENVPERAFREAVANAIVHRKWNVDAHIRIEMYSDRIEIFSPGGLPAGVTVDDYVKLRENIAGEWLPGSGYTLRNAPELAIYHWYTMPDHQEKRYIEIWIPVEA